MDLVTRFLSFDKLMGAALVKIVYFLGLLAIALGAVAGLLQALGMLVSNFFGAIGALLMTPIIAVLAICALRFICEIYVVVFRMGEDLSAIRAAGPSPMAKP